MEILNIEDISDFEKDYEMAFSYKDRADLLREISSRVNRLKHALEDTEEMMDHAFQTCGSESLEEIEACLSHVEFHSLETYLTDNLIYIGAMEGAAHFQLKLALLLRRKREKPINDQAVIYWMKKAANSGVSRESYRACVLLSEIYETGMGNVKPDSTRAKLWHSKAIALKEAIR
jgi:TPR repeat protein